MTNTMRGLPVSQDSTNLDFLRATAVLLVFLDHSIKFLARPSVLDWDLEWLGRFGVLLFFVHTCTVLMLSLERQQGKFTGLNQCLYFYIRRTFRIYPLSLFCVLLVVWMRVPAGRILPGSILPAATDRLTLLSNALLIQNLTFSDSIIGQLWSLPFELQMYLFLPPLFFLAARWRSMRMLFCLWALSLPAALYGPRFVARASLLTFVPHFLPGVIAYSLSKKVVPRLPAVSWTILILALICAFMLHPGFEMGWWICLLLGGAMPFFHTLSNRPLTRGSHLVARYSYGIYLTHGISLWLAFICFASIPRPLQFAVFLASAGLFPVLLFHLIEQPFIRIGTRVGRIFSAVPPRQPVPVASGGG